MCEVCRESTAGRTYTGHVNTTVSGRQCQRWSSNTPHHINSAFIDNGFPDGSAEAAENYCRNPDKDYLEGVWCYTTDVDVNWEACDVPECGESVLFQLLPDLSLFVVIYRTAKIKLACHPWRVRVFGRRLFLFLSLLHQSSLFFKRSFVVYNFWTCKVLATVSFTACAWFVCCGRSSYTGHSWANC